jgi:neutral ceramidase
MSVSALRRSPAAAVSAFLWICGPLLAADFQAGVGHPGATALFVMLCGGDQNPNPRGTLDLAVQYGRALAAEVARVLGAPLRPVHPPIRTALEPVSLDFAPHTRATFEEGAKSPDVFRQRRSRLMLVAYDGA